jgi:hypothetical protein
MYTGAIPSWKALKMQAEVLPKAMENLYRQKVILDFKSRKF